MDSSSLTSLTQHDLRPKGLSVQSSRPLKIPLERGWLTLKWVRGRVRWVVRVQRAVYSLNAPSTIQIQAAAITAMRAATTRKRSRRARLRERSSQRRSTPRSVVPSGTTKFPLILVEGVEHAVLVPGDLRQRAVPAVQVEFDRPPCSWQNRRRSRPRETSSRLAAL